MAMMIMTMMVITTTTAKSVDDDNVDDDDDDNDDRDVRWLLCWDHQDDPQCQKLVTSGAGTTVTMERCLLLILFHVLLKQVLL